MSTAENADSLYNSAFALLNDEQRAAVECIDGPLLVIAGPGTGKTQLLSTRAAHILRERAVGPKNILCLTFTDAGSRAMSQRLINIIGQDAYDIEVSTFHAFASHLSSRYPEFFDRSVTAALISDLHKREIINGLLNELSVNAAGRAGKREGINSSLSAAMKFIDDFKKTGLSVDQYRAITAQTLGFMELAEADPVIAEYACEGIKGARANDKKLAIFEGFAAAVNKVYSQAPDELKAQLVDTPGIYTPYATYFVDLVNDFDVYSDKNSETGINEKGNATGVSQFQSAHFNKDAPGGHVFKDYKRAQRSLDMIDIYEKYMAVLRDEDLYDYDDIINDAISAIEENAELRTELAMRYEYIQVDEFQDTNGSQMRLLELIASGDRPNVMAVGDDDQAIMRFQGATVECIEQFKRRWHPEEVFLTTNYRSAPNIIDLGQTVAKQIENRLQGSEQFKNIKAPAGRADVQSGFSELAFPSEDAQYHYVVRKIQEIIDSDGFREGIENGRIDASDAIGVIAPKHACLRSLMPYLDAADISYSYKVKRNVLEIEAMQTLIATMRFVCQLSGGHEDAALACLPQIIAAPETGLSHEEIVGFMIDARAKHGGDWLASMLGSTNADIAALGKKLVGWAGRAAAAPVRQLILEMAQPSIGYYGDRDEDPWSSIELNAGIRALMRFVEQEAESAALGRAIRLADVVERIDMLVAFGISVDTEIEIGDASAVHLTTIHSSKGLEYEWVFLLDAEDGKWHYNGQASQYVTPNIYMSVEKDEDDHRRALFVAITRAKNYLFMCRGTGKQIRELAGSVGSEEAGVREDELAEIIQTDWRDGYALDEPRFVNRVVAEVKVDRLSVSKLNRLVTYDGNEQGFGDFLLNGLLRIPTLPFISADFGTLVHAFMNMYVKEYIYGDGSRSVEQIAEQIASKIKLLDFPEDEIVVHLEKFTNILEGFVPAFGPFQRAVSGQTRLLTEIALNATSKSGVPLFGLVDLMEADDAKKQIRIYDYKTGKFSKSKQVSYDRQLLFYKYLVEQSGEYPGYEVVDCTDCYVEQIKEETSDNPARYRLEIDDMPAEIDHLDKLISAAWKRIQNGDYDNSDFAGSIQMKEAQETCLRADGNFKPGGRARFQRLYEIWLIEASEADSAASVTEAAVRE